MGFRNPFRLQVDENDVAYVTDYSPDAQTPQRSRGPAGVGRLEIVRKPANYGWPPATRATSATTAGTSASSRRARRPSARRWTTRRSRSTAATRRPASTTRAGCVDGGPALEPGLALTPPVTDPDIWYSYRDNNAAHAARHAVLRLLRDDPGADRAGLDHRVPAAVPGALHRRRRPARRGEVPLRPGQPEHEEVPAVLRQLGVPGRVHAGHAARGQARRAEPRLQDQQRSCDCGAGERRRPGVRRSSATTRWTCSSGTDGRSTC